MMNRCAAVPNTGESTLIAEIAMDALDKDSARVAKLESGLVPISFNNIEIK